MVAISQSVLALLPLAVYIQAWTISPQSGPQCEDPEEGNIPAKGEKGVTSGGPFDWCERNVNVWGPSFGIRSILVEKWDEGCDIAIWESNNCAAEENEDGTWKAGDEDPIKLYKHEDFKADGTGTRCIMNVQKDFNDPANPPVVVDFAYDCEGVLRGD
jgi:hypothetical protein